LYDDHHIRRLVEIKHLLKDRFFSIKGTKLYLQGQYRSKTKRK